jgi:hypothetical protein
MRTSITDARSPSEVSALQRQILLWQHELLRRADDRSNGALPSAQQVPITSDAGSRS